jgi:hypothetical protein
MSIAQSPAIAPANSVVDPPHQPEQLAQAVLASLSRPRWGYAARPWGIFKAFLLASISLGLWPLCTWTRRFENLMTVEQQQFWHLAEWLRLRTGRPEAQQLRQQAGQLGPPSWTKAIVWIVLLAAVFIGLFLPHFQWDPFWLATLGFTQSDQGTMALLRPYFQDWGIHLLNHSYNLTPYVRFWDELAALLSAGYILHWLQVCMHAGQVEKFTQQFNATLAAAGERAPRAKIAGVGLGLQPAWVLTAVISILFGAGLWMIPMALAGVVHRRYVLDTGRQARAQLAQSVQAMLASSRPALDLPAKPGVQRPDESGPNAPKLCINEKCRSPLPPGAAFCPRCGARADNT